MAIEALRASGSDYEWARDLPTKVASLGLEIVAAEAEVPYFQGGSPTAEFHWLTGEQGRPVIAKADEATRELFERAQQRLLDPEAWFLPPAMIAVTARRPG